MVGPQPERVGGLPLAVAQIGVVVAGGAAPVDLGDALAGDVGAELPEVLADAALAAAVPAGDHGVGDALRLDQAVRHQRGALARTHQRLAAGDRLVRAGRAEP